MFATRSLAVAGRLTKDNLEEKINKIDEQVSSHHVWLLCAACWILLMVTLNSRLYHTL
jgi:hypothetical protein